MVANMAPQTRRPTARRAVGLPFLLLIIGTLGAGGVASRADAEATASSEPANVGDAKRLAREYYDSGAYMGDLEAVDRLAEEWLTVRASQVARPALVLDVDDTALSNWVAITANDFGRVIGGPCDDPPNGPCGWYAWDLLGRSPAIPATVALVARARALGVTVFFITGRDEPQRTATERNLREVGYTGFAKLFMPAKGARYRSAADFKAPCRAEIEAAGYTIIANVGDQPSDLAGGHAERTFLLPNPFYRIP